MHARYSDFDPARPAVDPAHVPSISYAVRQAVSGDRTLPRTSQALIAKLADYLKLPKSLELGYAWPSHAELMQALGCSLTTLKRAMRRVGDRYIVVKPGDGRRNSEYRFSPIFVDAWLRIQAELAEPNAHARGANPDEAPPQEGPQEPPAAADGPDQPRRKRKSGPPGGPISAPEIYYQGKRLRSVVADGCADRDAAPDPEPDPDAEARRADACARRRAEQARCDRARQAAGVRPDRIPDGWSNATVLGRFDRWGELGLDDEQILRVIAGATAKRKKQTPINSIAYFERIVPAGGFGEINVFSGGEGQPHGDQHDPF